MDTLSIKKYHRQGYIVDNEFNSLKRIKKADKLPKGNTTFSKKGLIKADRDFLEFFINDVPLTELLNEFYKQKGSVLDNWIGVLGWTANFPAEIIKLKQLLGKNVTDHDIRKVYPASWTDNDFEYYLEKYRDELSNPEIIIYCCAECGDYDCGGITVSIQKTDNSVVWTIVENDKTLNFEFDKYLYFDTFQNRIKYLENNTR
jgi:hypothetical protein